MKFCDFISKHISEIVLFTIVVFALISIALAFCCEKPICKSNNISIDSTQVINVRLIEDSINYEIQ